MYNIYLFPSYYSHIINGLLLVIACVIVYTNYSKLSKLDPYKLIMLVLIFSISIGIHGLSHLGLEKTYHYNPLQILYI